ncbi:MAG: BBP7 family outer membrane beta-barrel protein [Planctomycetaceae bacterium]|nr:BBP7 family outer membrane beta-barrel protein [Planctomycetaceae bacterium]
MNEPIHRSWSRANSTGQIVCLSTEHLLVGKPVNKSFVRLQKKLVNIFCCTAVLFQICYSAESAFAQNQPEVVQAYGQFPSGYNPQGQIQQVQQTQHVGLPKRPQYYEQIPARRGWEDRVESPLDRFLKQSFRQTYGRVDYLSWSFSDPGSGFIGAPGKKLGDGGGFSKPVFIDGVPLQTVLLQNTANNKVFIQTWEANESELVDRDVNGFFYDIEDVFINGTKPPVAGIDGINDDDNDIDIFPRITNAEKELMLSGQALFTTGVVGDPSQVAVLAIGQLAPMQAFQLDNNNGFRGVVGIDLLFGAIETDFFVMNTSRSSYQYIPITGGLIRFPGTEVSTGVDPMVIPVLVNGEMAPNIYDNAGNLITDSNNFYLLYNDSYIVDYKTEAWGFNHSMFWTLRERPGRFKLSGSLGFRYFDFREQMLQQGSFSDDDTVADFTYNTELGGSLDSTIDSVTKNSVYGSTAGLRAEVGDERFSLGLDTKVLLGLNTHEAKVAVDDLLFVGDDNFTRDKATDFAPGFEMVFDTKVKIAAHATLVVGYNFLWFGEVTRPADNIYYDINATRIIAPALGGPDYTLSNNVIVNKKKTSISLSGVSVGLVFDW